MGRIYINFKRPIANPLWIGVRVYVKKGINGDYELKNHLSNAANSVKLNAAIDAVQTTIPFDDSTLEGSFPGSGEFWIEDEFISYSSINDTLKQFEGCVRGANASTHPITAYIHLKTNFTPSISYVASDIGSTWYIKLVSINIAGALSPIDDAVVHTVVLS